MYVLETTFPNTNSIKKQMGFQSYVYTVQNKNFTEYCDHDNRLFRGFLYESGDRIKNETGGFLSHLCMEIFFNRDEIGRCDRKISLPPFWEWNLTSDPNGANFWWNYSSKSVNIHWFSWELIDSFNKSHILADQSILNF